MNTTTSCYDVVNFVMIFTIEQEARTGKITYVFRESAFYLCHIRDVYNTVCYIALPRDEPLKQRPS